MTLLIVTNKRSKPRVKILSPKSGNLSFSRSVSLCSTNYHSDHFDDVDDDCINNNDDDHTIANKGNYNTIDKTTFASKSDANRSANVKDHPSQRHVLAVIDGNRTNAQTTKPKSNMLNNLFVKQDEIRNDTSQAQIVLTSSKRSSLSVSSIQQNHSRSISLLSHDSSMSHNNNNNNKKRKSKANNAHVTTETKSKKVTNDNELNSSWNEMYRNVSHIVSHKCDDNTKNNYLPRHKSHSRETTTKKPKNTMITPAEVIEAGNVQNRHEQSKSHNASSERVMLVQSILQKAGEHVLRKNLSAKYAAQLQAQQQKAERLLTAEVQRKRNRSEIEESNYSEDNDEDGDEAVFYLQRNYKMQHRSRRYEGKQKIDDNDINQCVDSTFSSTTTFHTNTQMITSNNNNGNVNCSQINNEEYNNKKLTFEGEEEVKALTKYDEVCPGMFCGLSALTIPSKLFANTEDEVIESNKVNTFDPYKRTYPAAQSYNKSDNVMQNTLCKENDLQQGKQVHSRQRCCVRPIWSLVGTFKCGLTSFVDVDFNQQYLRWNQRNPHGGMQVINIHLSHVKHVYVVKTMQVNCNVREEQHSVIVRTSTKPTQVTFGFRSLSDANKFKQLLTLHQHGTL